MTARKLFDEDLASLKQELKAMCELTEVMIENAIKALINQDRTLAKSVSVSDKKVNEYELDIEKRCMRILLKQQPVAKDFIFVATALKMITDIERFGDQASDIGDLVATSPDEKYIKELVHLKLMGELAVKMAHNSVESFLNGDDKLASETIQDDDEMDGLFITVKNELIGLIKKDSANADQAIMFMMITKYLERIGDHAVNVSEWTKYKETGEHVKFQ